MVYVQVIGTEEIGSTSFAKHTEYVVEIKYIGVEEVGAFEVFVNAATCI
jgi:hypothetical protein